MKSWQPFKPLKKVPNSAPTTGTDKLKACTPLPFFDKLRPIICTYFVTDGQLALVCNNN